jgi:ataxia telangiectasia mutated family protein
MVLIPLCSASFTDAHLIVAIRKSLLSAANSRAKEPAALGNMLSERSRCLNSLTVACELSICALARKSLRAPEAINAITDARRAASELDDITQQGVAEEFAQVLWMKGEHALAIDQLQRIQSQLRAKRSNHQKEDSNKLASVLGTLVSKEQESNSEGLLTFQSQGEWLWAAKQAKADAIERNYFAEAVDRISGAPSDEKARVFARYAHFADQQQQALSADAGDVGSLRAAAEAKRREIQDMERRSRAAQTQEREIHTAHSLSRHARRLRLELDDDLQRLKEVTVSRLQYLTTACRMYAKALATSDTEDDGALRLCALWLEHFADDEFNGKIQTDLMAVPTWKFGTLIQQLTARLHKDPGEARPFQVNLEAVLVKLCHDHPFHIVYSILTLAHPLRKASRRQSAHGSPREQAALDLITRVKTGARAKIVAQMDMFASAAIQWAETGLDKDKKLRDGLIMPATMPLAQLQNLDIPIPTADLPYDKTLSYNAVVTLRAYDSRYSIAGGQSRTKVMKAIGSDGRVHRELVGVVYRSLVCSILILMSPGSVQVSR